MIVLLLENIQIGFELSPTETTIRIIILMRFKIKYIIVIWLSNTCSAGLNGPLSNHFQYFFVLSYFCFPQILQLLFLLLLLIIQLFLFLLNFILSGCLQLNCFMFSRLCISHQQSGKCNKGSACALFHLCRKFVLGVPCEKGENCPLGHKVIGRMSGVVNTWTNKQRLQFVRRCHPQVCEKYNGPEGCHFGENCHFLHVCNEFILGTPHSRRCSLSHELSSAHSRRVLTHFMLSDVFF